MTARRMRAEQSSLSTSCGAPREARVGKWRRANAENETPLALWPTTRAGTRTDTLRLQSRFRDPVFSLSKSNAQSDHWDNLAAELHCNFPGKKRRKNVMGIRCDRSEFLCSKLKFVPPTALLSNQITTKSVLASHSQLSCLQTRETALRITIFCGHSFLVNSELLHGGSTLPNNSWRCHHGNLYLKDYIFGKLRSNTIIWPWEKNISPKNRSHFFDNNMTKARPYIMHNDSTLWSQGKNGFPYHMPFLLCS